LGCPELQQPGRLHFYRGEFQHGEFDDLPGHGTPSLTFTVVINGTVFLISKTVTGPGTTNYRLNFVPGQIQAFVSIIQVTGNDRATASVTFQNIGT
jgi:hypothetical protein